jgi:hypothetical protein
VLCHPLIVLKPCAFPPPAVRAIELLELMLNADEDLLADVDALLWRLPS